MELYERQCHLAYKYTSVVTGDNPEEAVQPVAQLHHYFLHVLWHQGRDPPNEHRGGEKFPRSLTGGRGATLTLTGFMKFLE